jgi:hypothetical protein
MINLQPLIGDGCNKSLSDNYKTVFLSPSIVSHQLILCYTRDPWTYVPSLAAADT